MSQSIVDDIDITLGNNAKLKVIGVGGGGGNAVQNMITSEIIFSKYVLPKVLKRMSLKAEECVVTEEGLDAIVELHKNTSGIRDLEQAAEHIAANALYQIEVDHLTGVTFNAEMVRGLLS